MAQEIFFHVMVPVYKVERYLDECVQSVLSQTYQNFELILVDDGSPDRCGAMCDAWAEKDSRIRVFHKPNGGLMHTRRFAIARVHEDGMTKRDFGVFLDSDDTLRPNALETITAAMESHDCDCVIFGMERVLEGKTLARLTVPAEEPLVVKDKEALCSIVMLDEDAAYYSMCRKAVRMELLSPDMEKYAPYYHISIAEDALQSLEIYQNAESFCFLPDTLYDYRLNPNSMTQTITYENYRVEYTVPEKELAFLRQAGLDKGTFYAAYRSFRIHALTGELVRIAELKTSRKNKTKLYEAIKSTAYWKTFLSAGGYDPRKLGKMVLLYEAFRLGQYWLIFLLTAAYNRLHG